MPIFIPEEENLAGIQGFSVRSIAMDAARRSVEIVLNSWLNSSSDDRAGGLLSHQGGNTSEKP